MHSFLAVPEGSGYGSAMPVVHGGGDDGAGTGLFAALDQLLDRATRLLDEGPSSWNLVEGITGLGANVHPLIVHFPIAFLFGFLVLEIAGLILRSDGIRRVASGLLYLGAFCAVAAATAGLIASEIVPHGEEVHDIMEWHERLGLTVASLAVALAIWRALSRSRGLHGMAEALHLSLALIMGTCLVFGADLGGLMVYQYGVGVKSLQEADGHHHHGGDSPEAAAARPEAQTGENASSTEPQSGGTNQPGAVRGGAGDQQSSPQPVTNQPEASPSASHHDHHHHHHDHTGHERGRSAVEGRAGR